MECALEVIYLTTNKIVLLIMKTYPTLGAEKDETNIKEFMENVLRFRCDVVKDPTKDQLMRILEGTAVHLNRFSRNYYCFTFFIMGHGSSVSNIITHNKIYY